MDRALDGCPEDHKEDIGVWRSIFDPQNGFFQTIDLIFNLAALSLLWVALCIPVVTAGPATTALYYTLVKCIRKGEPHPFRNFLECLKSNFKVSFLSGLVCLVLGQFVLGGLYVVYQMALAGSRPAMSLLLVYGLVTLVLLGVLGYVFPLPSRSSEGGWGALSLSFRLALGHLPSTLVLGVLLLAAGLVSARYLAPLLLVPALTGLAASLLLERIFRPYTIPEEGLPDDPEERPWYLR